MSSLFSHAPVSLPDDVEVPAARTATVVVPVPITEAFDGFTDGIHLWWPMDSHSNYGADAHIGFEDGLLLEDSFTGVQTTWGDVRSLEQPASLVIAWQLGGHPSTPTTVHVDFTINAERSTMVAVTHDGWSSGQTGAQQYEKYCDWPLILSRFARFMGGGPKVD